jgi:hypothetical protein
VDEAPGDGETVKPGHPLEVKGFPEFGLLGFAVIETSLKPGAFEVSGFSWVSVPLKPSFFFSLNSLEQKPRKSAGINHSGILNRAIIYLCQRERLGEHVGCR